MRHLAFAALVAALPFAGLQGAQAMAAPGAASGAAPAAVPGDAGIQLVSGGCGPYGHRDYYGRCVRNFYGPPPVYRACPPGFHLGPYRRACVPNF